MYLVQFLFFLWRLLNVNVLSGLQITCNLCVQGKKNYLLSLLKPTSKLRMRENVNVILLEYRFQQRIDFDELMVCFLEIVSNK